MREALKGDEMRQPKLSSHGVKEDVRRLGFAILSQALYDLGTCVHNSSTYHQAFEYMTHYHVEDYNYVFSFASICSMMELRPDAVAELVQRHFEAPEFPVWRPKG